MKLRVTQDNNVVVITIISLSEKLTSKFKKRRQVCLIKENTNDYLGVFLRSKKSNYGSHISNTTLTFDYNGIELESYVVKFNNHLMAENFIQKLKNTVNLINYGTKVALLEANTTLIEVKTEIFE